MPSERTRFSAVPTAPFNYASTPNSKTAPVRKGQIEVAKKMLKVLLQYGMAELVADPKWGKTITVSIAALMLHHSLQQTIPSASRRRNTLVWNWSPMAPFDKSKCIEFGVYDNVPFVASNKQMVRALQASMEEHGFAAVYSSKEAFNGAAGTQRDKETTFGFSDLTVESIRTTKPQTLPKLAMLIDMLQVRNLIIVVDEHQGLLGQSSQNFASLVANHVALSQAEWKAPSDRYGVYTIAASATPEDKSPSVNRRTHVRNMELFYKRRDAYGDDSHLEAIYREVATVRSNVVVSVTEEEQKESLDNFRWQTGTYPSGGAVPRGRDNIIAPPTNGTVVAKLQKALVMQALMDKTDRWVQNWGSITLEGETSTLYFKAAKPKAPRDGEIVLSPGCVHASVRGYQSVLDAVAFVRGHFVDGRSGIDIHSRAPQQAFMRKVTRLTHNPNSPVETVPQLHYHCVLVVIGQISMAGLKPLQDACKETNTHTTIYDCTGEHDEYLVELMEGNVRDEFKKNKKQIYIVTRLGQIVGANCFGDFVTACVTIGNIPSAVRRQCYERLARSTKPEVDMVIPNPGDYKFYHLGSSATQRLDKELNHAQPDAAFCAMVATGNYDEYKDMEGDILEHYGDRAASAFRKYFFYSTGGTSNVATPIDIGGSVAMADQYWNMLPEKKQFSDKWKLEVKKHLTWIARMRA